MVVVMSDVSDRLSYKTQLQELMQKSYSGIPMYQTIIQGCYPNLGFKSSVVVDGVQYSSEKVFRSKKAAEIHMAEVAFKGASQKFKSDALSIITKDPVFYKSIVNEYATKMNIAMPVYHTVQIEELLPVFASSLVFNGVPYSGEACRSKKDSEQLAARAVIISILGRSDTNNTMSALIKSKWKKRYNLLLKGKDAPCDYVVAEVVNSETNLVTPPQSQVETLVVDTMTDDNSMGFLPPPPHTVVDHHDPVVVKLIKTEPNLSIQPPQIEGKESEITKIGGDNIVCGTVGGPTPGKRSKSNQNMKRKKRLRMAAQVAIGLEPKWEVPIAAAAAAATATGDVHLDSSIRFKRFSNKFEEI